MKPLFITGIDTGIGKTIVSAILVEKLKADYWKPVQSGDLEESDTMKVRSLVSNQQTRFHDEAFRLSHPISPHKSAALDGITISLEDFKLPLSDRPLVIEGAGGLLVPLNREHLMVDLIAHLGADVVVVSKNYLGSINHTLLTLNILKTRNIPVRGIIFNGNSNPDSEEIILNFSGAKCLGNIPQLPQVNKEQIREATRSVAGIEASI